MGNIHTKVIFLIIVTLFLSNLTPSSTVEFTNQDVVQTQPRIANPIIPDSPAQLNESDLTNFMNESVTNYMDERNVAGILLSVVKDGALLLSSGYGYADVDAEILASANDTLFGIASISKTFMAIAVMTLVENGTLDLDEDINNYLESFQIPLIEGSDPITLAHLMSHTAGFEESLDPVFYSSYSSMPAMRDFLQVNMPAQVHPVGYIQSYSNLGASLAGLVVQEVTGISYEEYLEQSVLTPLGLDSTTAYQQVPSSIDAEFSHGYSYFGGTFIEKLHYYCVVPPTGGMASTAEDMAQFMIMLLNEGNYDGDQFLETETVLEMQAEQFKGHPDLNGVGYGLYTTKNNNQSLVYHTGGMPTFSSIMALIPEHEVGIFISVNTDTGDYDDILDLFMDRYFPAPAGDPRNTQPISSEQLEQCIGYYLPTRREYVGLSESLISLYSGLITQIVAMPDDSLVVTSNYLPIDGMRFEHTGDLVFRDQSGLTDIEIAFRMDDVNVFMFLSLSALTAMEKLQSWYLDVTGPESVEINESDSSYQIYWTVTAGDWQANTYTIFVNGMSVVSSYWTPTRGITYDMSTYPGGTYNLTIEVKDVLGAVDTHTIIVDITPKPVDVLTISLGVAAGAMILASLIIILHARKH